MSPCHIALQAVAYQAQIQDDMEEETQEVHVDKVVVVDEKGSMVESLQEMSRLGVEMECLIARWMVADGEVMLPQGNMLQVAWI